MADATVHITDLGGYAGPATCYRLDPPKRLGGHDVEYVTVYVTEGFAEIGAKVTLLAAGQTGAPIGSTMRARGGSFTLDEDYDGSPARVAGAHAWALLTLGGYTIRQQDAGGTE
ncbi:hypothetical protein [Nocardia salmonicida]|uniref:hypothetical protein n=1 Tax=Nocardia salmonicida TaxID=53431 RepID=UPI0036343DB8